MGERSARGRDGNPHHHHLLPSVPTYLPTGCHVSLEPVYVGWGAFVVG